MLSLTSQWCMLSDSAARKKPKLISAFRKIEPIGKFDWTHQRARVYALVWQPHG